MVVARASSEDLQVVGHPCIPPWITGAAIDQNGLYSKYNGIRSSLFIPNFLVRVVLNGILLVKVILYARSKGQKEKDAGWNRTHHG